MIGQYSVLFSTKFVFRIVAKTTAVRILTLSDEFFVEYGDREAIPGLQKAIKLAEDYEQSWGLPTCDFKKFDLDKKETMKLTVKESLNLKLHVLKKRLIMLSKLNTY